MPASCDREIRDSRRGAGECDIRAEVKLRNGDPNWWCRTHGMEARGPGGAALDSCPGAWFDLLPPEEQFDIDLADGETAIWGALPPALSIGTLHEESGKVHVHHRAAASAPKDLDASYALVRLRLGGKSVLVEGTAAVACSISELSGHQIVVLACPHCHEVHIDEKMFATRPHRKHLCNSCGRSFNDRSGPSISNPLASILSELGLPPAPTPVAAPRTLAVDSVDVDGIALWPSNAAIVSTMSRAEEEGIHVHAWNDLGALVVDDTYATVTLDGRAIDLQLLRVLAVQRALAHGAPVVSLGCAGCGRTLVSGGDGWMEPKTAHICASCGETTRTTRKSFVNPLAEVCPKAPTQLGANRREVN